MKLTVIAAAVLGLALAAGPMDAGPAKAAPAMAAGDPGQGMLVADGHSFRPPPPHSHYQHRPSSPRHWRQYNESRPSDQRTVFRPVSPRTSVPGAGVNSMPRPLAPRVPAGQQVYRPVAPRQYTPGTSVNSMPRPPAGSNRFGPPPRPRPHHNRPPHRSHR